MKSRHNNILTVKLAERRAAILESLGAGVDTWETYQQLVGQLRGLDEAQKLGDDADHELDGGS